MPRTPYDTLAGVYEWLVPDALLTPAGSADAFADAVDQLERYLVLARRPAG